MRCLENILRNELIEEDTIELMSMDNSDIDMFLTNEEYEALNNASLDILDPLDPSPRGVNDCRADGCRDRQFTTDDDNAANSREELDTNSILKHYDGCEELDSLNMSDINKEYDIINGEEKYDG